MGQVAEDMLDGTACSYCGQFFIDDEKDEPMLYTHGFPVVCWECYDPEDSTYPKSHKPTVT